MKQVLLNVKRFKQYTSECGIAAASSIANYYKSSINYESARNLLPQQIRKNGVYTSQQARILNRLGFKKVSIVTSDLSLVDFSWRNLSKKRLIAKLKQLSRYYNRTKQKHLKLYVLDMIDWLEDKTCDNKLIIDYNLPKYIKRSIGSYKPVGACFNWTSLFRMMKSPKKKNGAGDIYGEPESHAVVIRGYDEEGIFIVDSHHAHYRGKLKKYRKGYYKLLWANFLVNAQGGDLLLVHG